MLVRGTTPIRIVSAGFLLTLIVMQWCLGFMYFRQVYFADVTSAMTAEEQDLAESVHSEYGFRPDVRIHREIDLSYLNALGYGAPFALEHHVRGQAISFTLNETGPVLLAGEVILGGDLHDTGADQDARLCAERLFSPLFVPEFQYYRSGIPCVPEYLYAAPHDLRDLCHPDPLAPPPRLV